MSCLDGVSVYVVIDFRQCHAAVFSLAYSVPGRTGGIATTAMRGRCAAGGGGGGGRGGGSGLNRNMPVGRAGACCGELVPIGIP